MLLIYCALYDVLSVLPHMVERKSGHIVFVRCLEAKKGLTKDGLYVAAEFALSGFAEVMRLELYKSGVHVTTILPGRIDTPMIEHFKVPWISRKVPPDKAARAIIRGIERRKAEVIVSLLQAPYGYLNVLFQLITYLLNSLTQHLNNNLANPVLIVTPNNCPILPVIAPISSVLPSTIREIMERSYS